MCRMRIFWVVLGWIVSILAGLAALSYTWSAYQLITFASTIETARIDVPFALAFLGMSLALAVTFNPLIFSRLPLARGAIGRVLVSIGITIFSGVLAFLVGDFVIAPLTMP